jgi:predicted dehydrogenase
MAIPIRVAVVGAGSIGAGLDAPGDREPRSHAGSYRAAGFELVALVDTDRDALGREARWGCALYEDFDTMMREQAPEAISLAVPAACRADLLDRALSYRPRVVIAEKPLVGSSQQAARIVAAYEQAGVPLIVNYTRRFMPFWQQFRDSKAMTTTIRYAKGIVHNGTHAIDLCRMLFGECLAAVPLARKTDYWDHDPTVTAFMRFERCPEVFLQALDERCFTLFEVDIVRERSRSIVDTDGRRHRWFELQKSVGIPPGRRLVEIGAEDTGAAFSMLNLMRHVRDVLDGAVPLCGGREAVAAQRIAEKLLA